MDDFIIELKNKFGYSDELTGFLSQLIPTLIKYYGEEYKDIILSAFLNCDIHFQIKGEDPKIYLNSYFGTEKDWEGPPLGGAFYHNEIQVKDNQVVAKPIVYIKTTFLKFYKQFDFSDDKQLKTLIHEICHMIKGYGKLKVKDGKIIDSTGLNQDTFSYSPENGAVQEKSEMLGIEEALNDVEAAEILEIMTGRPQEPTGYRAAGYSAKRLLQHDDIRKVLRASQFHGDASWIQYLGEEQSKVLIDNFDILVNALYISFHDIDTKEKIDAIHLKMGTAQDVIDDFVANYCSKESVEEFLQALAVADDKTIEIVQQMITVNQNVEEVSPAIGI